MEEDFKTTTFEPPDAGTATLRGNLPILVVFPPSPGTFVTIHYVVDEVQPEYVELFL